MAYIYFRMLLQKTWSLVLFYCRFKGWFSVYPGVYGGWRGAYSPYKFISCYEKFLVKYKLI